MTERTIFEIDLSDIRNLNEEVVIEIMQRVMSEDTSICRCQLCVEDIYALALNKLAPLYVQSTFKDRMFKGYDLTKVLDHDKVEDAVRDALKTVHGNPYH